MPTSSGPQRPTEPDDEADAARRGAGRRAPNRTPLRRLLARRLLALASRLDGAPAERPRPDERSTP